MIWERPPFGRNVSETIAARTRRGGVGSTRRRRFRIGLEALEDRVVLSGGVTVTADEQLFVYLLNRARNNPSAYQQQQNLSVDLSTVTPRPPLAVNDQLYASSQFHANEMATYNYFNHQSQVTGEWPNKMVRDQGYPLPTQATINGSTYLLPDDSNQVESIAAGYADAQSTLNALIVDQGENPPGHRIHLLGMDEFNAANNEIGVGHAYSASSTYGDYWAIHATFANPANEFLTGVVFNDANANGQYDLNEGLAGVTITVGSLHATTNAAGGWSLPITNGQYTVTASGGGFSGTSSSTVSVNGGNVEVDFSSGRISGEVNFGPWGNTAPTLAAGGPTLRPVVMNTANPPGQPISGFLGNSITDADPGSPQGIAVTGLGGNVGGTWQYSANGGANWTAIGSASPSSALLLPAVDLLRFVPAAGSSGTATIAYHAWDQSSGTAGGTADLTKGTGGATAFSTGAATATEYVVTANSAPVLHPSGAQALTVFPQDNTNPAGDSIAAIVGPTITDADPGAATGVGVVGVTGSGTWQYSLDAGAHWTALPAVSASSALLLRDVDRLRFLPTAGATGPATVTYHAWDQSSGAAGTTVDLSSGGAVGGNTAYSVATDTATWLNRAPVLNNSGYPILPSVSPSATFPNGPTVASLLGGSVTDPDPGAVQGIAVIGTTGTGTWYFNTAGGSSWFSATTNPQYAVLLRATDRVAFVPSSGFTGTATLSYRAWDQTTGSVSNTWADISAASSVGGNTAFSAAQQTASLFVGTPTASIQGQVFNDGNGNGTMDGTESGLAGATVYLDQDNDGRPESSEIQTKTDSGGNFSFPGLAPGTYLVRTAAPVGGRVSTPSGDLFTVTLTNGQASTGLLFGVAPAVTVPSVLDDTDASSSRAGSWTSSTSIGGYVAGYGGSYRWAAPGDGSTTSTWQLPAPIAGTFDVEATWVPGTNRASNAPYRIYEGNTLLATVRVDQRQAPVGPSSGGSTFQTLAVVTLQGNGPLRVVLGNDAGNYVVADAVRVAAAATVPAVADDGGPGYAQAGSWASASGYGGFGNEYRYAAPGNGSSTATWTTPGLAPGAYDVQVTWGAGSNRASNAPFSVYDGNTLIGTIAVNQQLAPFGVTAGGVAFQSLGVFNVTSGTLRVVLANNANGYVVADAVRIATPAAPAITDNHDAGYSQSGSWTSTATFAGYVGGYGGDYNFAAASGGSASTATATWARANLAAGSYDVEVTWVAASNRATNAPYQIYDGNTLLATVTVNQQLAPSGQIYGGVAFQSLGVFRVSSGTLRVVLGNNANGYVIADAMRVAPVTALPALVDNGSPGYAESGPWSDASGYGGVNNDYHYAAPGNGSSKATWTTGGLAAGSYHVGVTWGAGTNRATNASYQVFDGTTLLATVVVNQQLAPSGTSYGGSAFQGLGLFTITSGTLRVVLSNQANGYVVADALLVSL